MADFFEEVFFFAFDTPALVGFALSGAVADNAGNSLGLEYPVPRPFGPRNEKLTIVGSGPDNPAETVWSQAHFTGFPADECSALNSDNDEDALPNVVEFHLGTDPRDRTNAANPGAVPVVTRSGTSLRMEFGVSASNQVLGDGAVTQLVGQWSANMTAWTNITPVSLGDGRYRVGAPAVTGKIYLRLAVVPKP